MDAYLDPLVVDTRQFAISTPIVGSSYYLQTSPESAMKRMLAEGAPSIYSIGPVFRSGERGRLHNVEFTMLEWYDVGADMDAGVALLGALTCEILGVDDFDRKTYREVFLEQLRFDPIAAPIDVLRQACGADEDSIPTSIADDRDGLLDLIMARRIQPALGCGRPLILTDYPISQAALAKTSPDDPECAARFELFVRGVELANGYDELLDADELVRRYRINNGKRIERGASPLSLETRLLAAMRAGLPPSAGVALGVDRLLMLLRNADSIDEVIAYPIEDA